ncbi:MAG: hypothetical protein IPL23_30725 [Saprospiraceae bacterium]|nr:hypothetical protein [Saprospiraceae bacterium]
MNYDQTLSTSEVNSLIDDLEDVTEAIQNSRLISGPGSGGFSNKVRFGQINLTSQDRQKEEAQKC